MAPRDIITASRYNQLQAVAASILGTGSGDAGYGQLLESSPVPRTALVFADHMNRVRGDLQAAHVHQTGTNVGFNLPIFTSITDLIEDEDYVLYSAVANNLFTSRNTYSVLARSSNFTLEPNRISSTRTAPWGGTSQSSKVLHEVRVTFASADARRHFFNAGSEIRFEASLTNFSGGDQGKFDSWAGILNGMGVISFRSSDTVNSGSGTPANVGNFSLTTEYQQIFIRGGSLLYADNAYTINARAVTSSSLSFLIEFNDAHRGSGTVYGTGIYGIDDPVSGLLTSRLSQSRATGHTITNIGRVVVSGPGYQNTRVL